MNLSCELRLGAEKLSCPMIMNSTAAVLETQQMAGSIGAAAETPRGAAYSAGRFTANVGDGDSAPNVNTILEVMIRLAARSSDIRLHLMLYCRVITARWMARSRPS